jgi:hypothetical protein
VRIDRQALKFRLHEVRYLVAQINAATRKLESLALADSRLTVKRDKARPDSARFATADAALRSARSLWHRQKGNMAFLVEEQNRAESRLSAVHDGWFAAVESYEDFLTRTEEE